MDRISPHEERAARNEAAFRRLNENLAEDLPEGGPHPTGFVCECSATTCRRLVDLTADQYSAVREHPMQFFVVPGHEWPEVERVVETHENYLVVEKDPELARVIDPA